METENEVKKIQETLRVSNESNHKDDKILKMFSLWKALRIKFGLEDLQETTGKHQRKE